MRGFLENLWAQAVAYDGCDFVAAVARLYPSLTIATVLGAPHQAAAAHLVHLGAAAVRHPGAEISRDDIERAVTEAEEYVTGLLEARRAAPGDDLISELLAAREERGGSERGYPPRSVCSSW